MRDTELFIEQKSERLITITFFKMVLKILRRLVFIEYVVNLKYLILFLLNPSLQNRNVNLVILIELVSLKFVFQQLCDALVGLSQFTFQ
jgi:hypothetical protein